MSVAEPARMEAAWRTDTGRLRTLNEDAVLCFPERGLFAVIDGVGGEAGGDVGAREAAAVLRRRLSRDDGQQPSDRIREAVALANNRLLELAERDPRLAGMSCVLTVALVIENRLTIGHIGDTRLYRLRGSGTGLPEAQKLTRDHSPVGQMEELGEISESEAMRHPRRNEIYRDVGTSWHRPDDEDFVEIFEEELLPGDSLLICSDGLTDQVPLREIRSIVGAHAGTLGAAVDLLIEKSNAAGGRDNVSIVLVEASKAIHQPQLSAAGARTGNLAPEYQTSATHGQTLSTAQGPVRSAAASSRSGGRWKIAFGILGALVLASAAWMFWLGPEEAGRRLSALNPAKLLSTNPFGRFFGDAAPLVVGPTGNYTTIQGALDDAKAGQTVTVGPGTYTENLQLRDGVAIEVLPPRSATLRVPTAIEAQSIGVRATAIQGASISGLRIEATDNQKFDVGLQLTDSEVFVRDVLISGADNVAVEILGNDRSTLELLTLKSTSSPLLRVAGAGQTQVRQSLFERSSSSDGLAPMVSFEGAAAPLFLDNQLRGAGTAVQLSSEERASEVSARNEFVALEGQKAPKVSVRPPAVSSSIETTGTGSI